MNNQWIRKLTLVLFKGSKGVDLSQFHIKFNITNADVESPNTCVIRVYNLAKSTVKQIQGEFSEIVLNAGYVNGNFGVVFQGTIKQYRIGRETNTDTYLEIMAADGDIAYNQGVINVSLAKGSTPAQALQASAAAMNAGIDTGSLASDPQHTPLPRGKVLFGMARARLRNVVSNLDASWSIENGNVIITPLTGYRSDPIVEVNVATGLIGMPEQTDEGMRLTCLLNSNLRIGARVKLNNNEIIQLMQANPNSAAVPFNQWSGVQYNAPLSTDGIYRMFVVEHEGDTRGQPWYSHLTCLAMDMTAPAGKQVADQ